MRRFVRTAILSVTDLEVLRSFQNQIAAIQRDAVWWLHTVVPTISKVGAKDYVHWYLSAHICAVSIIQTAKDSKSVICVISKE